MIKFNETTGETIKCVDLLRQHGFEPYTRRFIYEENKDTIKAVAGLMWINDTEGLIVEPFLSLSAMYGYRLWKAIELHSKQFGAKYLIGGSDDNRIQRVLQKNGYKLYQKNINQYVKQLNVGLSDK